MNRQSNAHSFVSSMSGKNKKTSHKSFEIYGE